MVNMEVEKMNKVIGIDLGTTNSCVSVIEGDVSVIIPNSNGARTTPSIVAFTKVGERLIGDNAKRQLASNAERTISSVKRHMGTDWKISIDGKAYNPQTVSALILMQLKKDAENYLGTEVSDAVITVPAYFNDVQRQATKDAGKIAGLNVLRIINEPTSAALSYGLGHGAAQKIMVYDLGGGTFDVSIIEMGDGIIEVLATAGDNHLGGDDFDERIVTWIIEQFKKENRIDLSKDITACSRIKEVAEKAKIELSSVKTTNINLPFITQVNNNPLHFDVNLTRAKFNEITKDLIDRTAEPVQRALNDAGLSASELDRVLLVGGSTRIPAVQEKVRALTGKEPSRNVNPDECVAMGAAILGSTLAGNTIVASGTDKGLLLLDVTPMSLSIETVGGVATKLIERNSTLPTKYSRVFTTAAPYQRSVEINVLQGERPMARDNKSIGKLKLKGIRKAPAGVPQIEVTFDIDANGILKVSAKDLDTMKEQSITITANDRMSDAEIEQAMKEAQMYAGEDTLKRAALNLSIEANKLVSNVNTALKNAGKEIDKTEKKQIKKSVSALEKTLLKFKVEKVTQTEYDNMKLLKEELERNSESILARFGQEVRD